MKFIIALLAIVAVAQAKQMVGGWTEGGSIPDDMAQWTISTLSSYTNAAGVYTPLTVRNVKTQIVSGIKYQFTLDVLLRSEDNKYYFQNCEIMIFDQPWTNTRRHIKAPVCTQDPSNPTPQ